MDTYLIIVLLVLVGGTVTQASSDFIPFYCPNNCSTTTSYVKPCNAGETPFVTKVKINNPTKMRTHVSSQVLKEELQTNCYKKNQNAVNCFQTQLSWYKKIHKYEKVNVSYKCVNEAKTMKKNVHICTEDKLTSMRLDVQFYDSSWLANIETGKFAGLNEPEEINCSSSLSKERTCTEFKMDVGANIGVVWVKVSGDQCKKLNIEQEQCDDDDDKDTILIVVGVVAAVAIFSNILMCLVFVCRVKLPKRIEKRLSPLLHRGEGQPLDDNYSILQTHLLNNESSSYLGSAAGTPAISSTTSPDFKSAAAKFAATTGTLPTPRSPDSRSAGTNVQTTEREEYTYIALSGESLTPPVTSRPVDSSHLLSRRDSASQQRMLKTPMSTLQLSQAKGVCRSEISINRADARDIQVAQGQPKTRSPSFDDMYVNHQSENYRNFPAHANKGNTRSPNVPPYANSNIRPHLPPLANSTVYNSLNSLDGTYTHLKHVNPPERVIDNVYDG